MRIQRVEISNWRSIPTDPPAVFDLGDITLVAGQNDAGKSAILVVVYATIAQLLGITDLWLQRKLQLRGSKHVTADGEDSGPTKVTLTFRFDEHEVQPYMQVMMSHLPPQIQNDWLPTIFTNAGFPIVVTLNSPLQQSPGSSLPLNDKMAYFESQALLSEISIALQKVGRSLPREHIDSIASFIMSDVGQRAFANELTRVSSLHIPSDRNYSPEYMGQLNLTDEDIADVRMKSKEANDLIRFVDSMHTESGARAQVPKRFMRYVNILFPDIERVETTRTQDGHFDVFITRRDGRRQPLSRSGSGILNALYLVAQTMSVSKGMLVLVDEPETSFHPKLQSRFMTLLRRLSEEYPIQWILATHSPYFMRKLGDRDRLVLVEHNGSFANTKMINIEEKKLVHQVLGSYIPEVIGANAVVFVEGDTEAQVLPIVLRKLGLDCDLRGLLIFPMGGQNLYGVSPVLFKRLHENVMVIIDSDLTKSENEGGTIKKLKTDYEEKCCAENVKCVLDRGYRAIENMYPKPVLANVLRKSEKEVNFGRYEPAGVITDKVRIGVQVAEEMSVDQACEFPLTKAILDWWFQELGFEVEQ